MENFVPTTLKIAVRAAQATVAAIPSQPMQPTIPDPTAIIPVSVGTVTGTPVSSSPDGSATDASSSNNSRPQQSQFDKVGKPVLIAFIVILGLLSVCLGAFCIVRYRRRQRAIRNGITPPPKRTNSNNSNQDYFSQDVSSVDQEKGKFSFQEARTYLKFGK